MGAPKISQTEKPNVVKSIVQQAAKIPEYDDILDTVGEFGRWQKLLYLLVCIASAACATAVFMFSFIGYTPNHRCAINACNDTSYRTPNFPLNLTTPYDGSQWSKCSVFQYDVNLESCPPPDGQVRGVAETSCPNGWVYDDTLFPVTAATEMNMVCSNEWQNSFSQSMYMLGMLVGSFIFGILADMIGRRLALVIAVTILTVSGTISALIPASFPVFSTLRMVSGTGQVGIFILGFTLSVEYVGAKSRVFTGCLYPSSFAIGGIMVGLMSWGGLRNWRTLQLVCSAPCILLLGLCWILPESPRWLLAQGKFDQLEADVRKTARINRTEFPTWAFSGTKLESVESTNNEKANIDKKAAAAEQPAVGEGKQATLLDLFRPASMGLRTLVMFYNWMVTTLCYYGLTMAASSLSDDIFLNFMLLLVVEIPANFMVYLTMDRLGRKPILAGCLILSGVSCIGAGFLDSVIWAKIVLSLAGKFGATGCFSIVFVYTAEMFPTEIRSSAVGTSSTCARLAGIISPQVISLSSVWKPLPLIVMGSSAVFGSALALFFLPETLGQPMPETMEEALALGSKKKESDAELFSINTS